MKKKHPIHHFAANAWCYAMKRKLLTLLSAGLVAVAGLAASDAYLGVKHWVELHGANAAAVPGLVRDVAALQAQVAALNSYTNADCWRWRRQGNENTNLQQQIDRRKLR